MTFKEFVQLDETLGQFGDVKSVNSLLGIHRMEKRLNLPAQKKGTTSVGRSFAAGKVISPSRPAGLTAPNKPMTIPSLLGGKS